MRPFASTIVALGLVGCLPSNASESDFPLVRGKTFALDPALTEISGLAPAGPHSFFAHNDEHGTIFEIDMRTGQSVRSFSLGKAPVAADFEAIAADGERLYLTTSSGNLYEARLPDDGANVSFEVHQTGIGSACEVEGLAPGSRRQSFLFLCKNIRQSGKKVKQAKDMRRLHIYEWSMSDPGAAPRLAVDVAFADLQLGEAAAKFTPADLARDAETGSLFVLNARGGILHMTASGEPIAYAPLSRALHPQSEGLAIMPDGVIAVADEGKPTMGGRLALYVRH